MLGMLVAFSSSITWSIGSTVYGKLSRDYTAYTINFTRALIALPCFAVAALLAGHIPDEFAKVHLTQLIWLVVSMVCSYGIGDLLFFKATLTLGIPGALAIASAYPLWTALVSIALGIEVLSVPHLVGLIVTLIGIVVVILSEESPATCPKAAREKRASKIWQGVGFALVSSLFWTGNSYAVARVGQDLSPWLANTLRMFLGLFIVAGVSRMPLQRLGIARGKPLILPRSQLRTWGFAFFIEAFGGSFFFMYGLAHTRLSVGPILTSLAPILSVPVALALRSEKFSFYRTLGVGLAVSGLAVLVSI